MKSKVASGISLHKFLWLIILFFNIQLRFSVMAITLYLTPQSPPCRAVLMTAKYLNIPVIQKLLNLRAQEQLKPEFLKINPQHTVPTIDDDGFILWESRAIMTYLVNKYAPDSPLYPKDPQQRAVVDRLLYFDIGTLFKDAREYFRPQVILGLPADPEKEKVFQKTLQVFEDHMVKKTYAAGHHLTLADISIYAGLGFTEITNYNLESFPNTRAFIQNMKRLIPGDKEINEDPLKKLKEGREL